MNQHEQQHLTEGLGERREIRTPEWGLEYFERGEGEPVVFIHGLGVNPIIWRKVVPELSGSFRCICPVLPLGSHSIPMPSDADLTLNGLAALVDAFLKELDLQGVTLVGNDTGGAIAQTVAANHPERLARLVLTPSDTFDHFPPPQFRILLAMAWTPGMPWLTVQQLRSERMRYLPFVYGKLVKRRMSKEVTDAYLEPAKRPEIRRDLVRVIRAARKRYLLEATERLRNFDKPTLLVWPPDDPVFRFDHAQRLAKLLPNARIVEIEDSWGFVSEDQPKVLASEIASFLRQP
ncbi:MAG: alpha/beta fold hydrolase [Actinomycetota bacterium]